MCIDELGCIPEELKSTIRKVVPANKSRIYFIVLEQLNSDLKFSMECNSAKKAWIQDYYEELRARTSIRKRRKRGVKRTR